MTNLEFYCESLGLQEEDIDKSIIPADICNICPVVKQCEKMYPDSERISNEDTKFDYLDYLTDKHCEWWDLEKENKKNGK